MQNAYCALGQYIQHTKCDERCREQVNEYEVSSERTNKVTTVSTAVLCSPSSPAYNMHALRRTQLARALAYSLWLTLAFALRTVVVSLYSVGALCRACCVACPACVWIKCLCMALLSLSYVHSAAAATVDAAAATALSLP